MPKASKAKRVEALDYASTPKPAEDQKEIGVADDYVAGCYNEFLKLYTTWNMRLPILGGRTPLEFWNDSTRDYAVLAAEFDDSNDPVEQYQSTISRDQTNTIYANHMAKMYRPSCLAQNAEQSIDRTMAKVGDAALEWAFKQDGWPSENGQLKTARVIHKACVQGTAYTLDVVTADGLDSQLMPNEEIFYPNLWQPNLQLQGEVFRVRLNMDVAEAEEEFGHLERWDQVNTQGGWSAAFIVQYPELKGIFDGIVQEDKVSAMYIYRRCTVKQLKALKAAGKVSKHAKRAWYYNVVLNDVAMFDEDNLCPYKSGILPISKLIFEPMAETEFALGNSVPNKCREDKRWKDAWKTNIRWRGKLGGMPPTLVIGGHLNGEEVMIPSAFTSVPQGVEVQAVPGWQPVGEVDLELMKMTDEEIQRSTIEPTPAGDATARTAMIQQANSQVALEPFSLQLSSWVAGRSFGVLMALFQFMPKSKLAKLVVPDQTLDDGLTGTFEVIFQAPSEAMRTELDNGKVQQELEAIKGMGVDVKEEDLRRLMLSYKLKQQQDHSRNRGEPLDTVYVDPAYVDELKFYIFSDAADAMQDKDALAQARFSQDMPLMLGDQTGSIVPKEVWREFVRMRGYNERILQTSNPAPQAPMPAQGDQGQPGLTVQRGSGLTMPPSTPNQSVDAAAAATGIKSPGKLSGV